MSWWGSIKKKAELQARKFSQSVSRATAAVKRTVSRGVAAVKKTGSKAGTAVKKTVSKVATTVKQKVLQVKKLVKSAVKATKAAIKKGIKATKTAAKKIVKATKAVVKKAAVQTKKFLNSAIKATKAVAKKTKEALKGAKQKATAFVKRKVGKVITQARKVKNNLSQSERIKQLKNDMRKALILSKSFGKGVWDGGKEAVTDTVELAKQLWYNPEQTVKNIGQSLKETYNKAEKFAGQMVEDPFGTTNKVIHGIQKKYDRFQKLSPEQQAYMIGKFGGNAGVSLVGAKGVSVVAKQTAKAVVRATPQAMEAISNERGSIAIGRNNRDKATQGTGKPNGNVGTPPRYGDRQITDEEYKMLRDETPTSQIRKQINKGHDKKAVTKDPALPGKTFKGSLEADHIVSMDKITKMDGFGKLTKEQKLEVLNNPENFIGLSKSANTSKGSKSYEEWTHYKKGQPGQIEVDPNFRNKMIKMERELERKLQQQIDDFNRKNNQ